MNIHFCLTVLVLLLVAVMDDHPPGAAQRSSSVLGVFFTIIVPPLFALLQIVTQRRRMIGAQREPCAVELVRSRMEVAHFCVWLSSCFLGLFVFHWHFSVRTWFAFLPPVFLPELLIVAPSLVALIFSWFVFQKLEVSNQGDRWKFSLRSISAFVGIPTVVASASKIVAQQFDENSTADWIFAGLSIAAVLYFVPKVMLNVCLATKPLDPDLASCLRKALSGRASLQNVSFCEWRTHSSVCNALAMPQLPRGIRVLFSDLLLDYFETDELVAIAKHELAHIEGRHSAWRLTAILLPFSMLATFEMAEITNLFHSPSSFELGISPPGIVVLFLISMLATYCFRLVSIACEFDADAASVKQKSPSGLQVVSFTSVETLIKVLEKLACIYPSHADHSGWLHPSLNQRIRKLERLVASRSSLVVNLH